MQHSQPELSIDWIENPSGVVRRGTDMADVDRIVGEHTDIGVRRDWILKEVSVALVNVPSFRISRTAVSQETWSLFSGERIAQRYAKHPVDDLTWEAAYAFCGWASTIVGSEVRLPTEIEWERAAQGDDQRAYPWGNKYEAGRANLVDAKLPSTCVVDAFPSGASPFGLLNMAGNVDEWTSTLYKPYPGAPVDVPTSEPWAVDRHVTRGGGFVHGRDLARCGRRHAVYPPGNGAGFRLATSS